jgi:hypothetical protein
MPKFWQTPAFKALESEWYAKLQQSGFADIERKPPNDASPHPELVLRQNSANAFRQADQLARESRVAYFERVTELAAREPWINSADQLIMRRRGEGVLIKDIARELESLGLKCHRQTIRYVIRKFEVKWAIRKWKPEQLRSKSA